MISLRYFQFFILSVTLTCHLWAGDTLRPTAPNILIIVSDDQGFGDFGCYGNAIIQTPHLDQLFTESTRLYNFYVSPVCAPTRASLMTGRYPYRTGVWDTWKGRENMRSSELTLAEILLQNGYRTGLFGKWHLGENAPLRPQDQGFEDTFLWTDITTRFDSGYEVNGESVRLDGFQDDLIFDHAIAFIEENRHGPFFCYVASFLPHNFPGGKQVPEEEVEHFLQYSHLTRGDLEVYAMIRRMDANIGRLLAHLQELGLDENTIVVFLSDNGPLQEHHLDDGEVTERFNYGLRGAKRDVYEGGIRVPSFWRWPGRILDAHDLAERTSVIDLFPTLLSLLDIAPPTSLTIDGLDLSTQLLGGKDPIPDRILFNKFERAGHPDLWTNSSATGPQYKMVNGIELYDLINDPGETTDLAKQLPKELTQLRTAYLEWFADVSTRTAFEGSRVWIGSDRQPEVRLKYWHADEELGFLTDIRRSGAFDILLSGLQSELIGPDSTFILLANGEEIARTEAGITEDSILLESVELTEGRTNLKLQLIHPSITRTLSYGENDPGYRFVHITKIQ
jgi:arylsulfatase A-like enzyme